MTEEVGRLLKFPGAAVVQYGHAHAATVVAVWSDNGRDPLPVGESLELDSGGVAGKVLRTGTAQRMERYDEAAGRVSKALREAGYRAAVAAPVRVGGRLWGRSSPQLQWTCRWHGGSNSGCATSRTWSDRRCRTRTPANGLRNRAPELVEASDAERRRLERNLHDGAQQRLVSVALDLRIAKSKLGAEPTAARKAIDAAEEDLASGLEDLRDLARGLHPMLLEDRGLGPALNALLARAAVPVEVEELPAERLAAPVETAAYYVVAETVTNVAKYAQASHATVAIRRLNGFATVTVSDDGVGGADPARGSGLRGLAARVEALNGRLEVDSRPQEGTRIRALIPV